MSKFKNKVKSKSLVELRSILRNQKDFVPEFIVAAMEELEERTGISESIKEEYLEKQNQKNKEIQERKAEKTSFIPKDLPNSIKYAAYLLYLSLAISLFRITSSDFSIGLTLGSTGVSISLGFLFQLVVAISVHKGRNWARWLYLVLLSIGVLLFLNPIINFAYFNLSQFFFLVVEIVPLVLLFVPDSKKWYKSQKGEQEEEEEFIFLD